MLNSTCVVSCPNLSHITLIWTVHARGDTVPTDSAENLLSSTVPPDREKGSGKGKKWERAPSAPPVGEGGGDATKRHFTHRGATNRQKDVGEHLCEPWDEGAAKIVEDNKKRAKEQTEMLEGTYDEAYANRVDTMTFPTLLNPLAEG